MLVGASVWSALIGVSKESVGGQPQAGAEIHQPHQLERTGRLQEELRQRRDGAKQDSRG